MCCEPKINGDAELWKLRLLAPLGVPAVMAHAKHFYPVPHIVLAENANNTNRSI